MFNARFVESTKLKKDEEKQTEQLSVYDTFNTKSCVPARIRGADLLITNQVVNKFFFHLTLILLNF